MNRIDRISAILIQLQSRRVVKAQDIAERFSISLRTVYRDIKALEEAGIPLIGEAGVGYSLSEGYRLPPVMFTREEATAFLTAEKLIEKFTDGSTENSYKSAMYKIRSVLKSAEKDMLETMEERIEIIQHIPFTSSPLDNTLQTLLKCISEKKVIHLRYSAFYNDTITERNIEPIGIFYAHNYWHCIAYCRLRKDYRDFRTDRILKLTPTEEMFGQNHPSLKDYLSKIAREEKLETIIFAIDKDKAKYLKEAKYINGFVSEKILDDKVEMTFLNSSPAMFIRWYAMFADHAEIIGPDYLPDLLKEHLLKVTKRNIGEQRQRLEIRDERTKIKD